MAWAAGKRLDSGLKMGFLDRLFGNRKSEKKETDTMSKLNVAVIYYSSTGTNRRLANWAGESAKDAGAEVNVL